jgi:hypothetical protein
MDPREAISRVEEIREQLARAETFRVYRAASTAFTGIIALAAALVQSQWQLDDVNSFLILWLSAASLSLTVVAMDMRVRCRMSDSVLLRDATITAARQFVPCVVAGGLLTFVLYRFAPHALGLLPGLWGICFALGVFASRPGLPRATNFVGAYYILAALLAIALAPSSPRPTFELWPMPVIFGVGQLLMAGVLYIFSEHRHDS